PRADAPDRARIGRLSTSAERVSRRPRLQRQVRPAVTSNRPASRARAILLAAAGATLCALFAASGAHAQHRDDHADRRAEHVDRRPDRIDRRPGRFDREREHVDARFHHDRVYYHRGVVVSALPRAHYDVVHGGRHFYYSGGIWYAPRGPRWVVIAPPFGAYV